MTIFLLHSWLHPLATINLPTNHSCIKMASGIKLILISPSLKKENVTHFCQSSERGEEKKNPLFFSDKLFHSSEPSLLLFFKILCHSHSWLWYYYMIQTTEFTNQEWPCLLLSLTNLTPTIKSFPCITQSKYAHGSQGQPMFSPGVTLHSKF